MTSSEVPAHEGLGPSRLHRPAFAAAAAVAVLLDQLAKQWALVALDDGPVDLVGSLRLRLAFNDSAAFSLGGGRTTAIALVALAVSAFIVRLGLRAEHRLWAIGLGAILGGALGNLVDRTFRAGDGVLGGRVVDFIDLQWWPVFNVADISLWVGIGLLAIDVWWNGEADR
ncbi:MAG: signal peptidase II [Microthrixaceae bacterium]